MSGQIERPLTASPTSDRVAKPERIFQALSAQTRLRILHLLQSRALEIKDLARILDLLPSTIRLHLVELSRAGLVATHKDAGKRIYSLMAPTSRFHEQLLACLKACTESMPILLDDVERLKLLDRGRPRGGSGTHRRP